MICCLHFHDEIFTVTHAEHFNSEDQSKTTRLGEVVVSLNYKLRNLIEPHHPALTIVFRPVLDSSLFSLLLKQ